ncbi:hypothetical protein IAR55_006197 [Kwoniella newhampshirensis]|uniref:N-acetyltransferase domain-containing protein n=1 Tax=Kwoniella newhampshirensis TaxID=1651941 RepID=A0AAW0YK23_9TREE
MSAISIRKAECTVADAECIVSIGRPVFTATFAHTCTPADLELFVEESYTVDKILTELKDHNTTFFFASMAGAEDEAETAFGFSQLRIRSTEPCLARYTKYIELQRIYFSVDVDHHGSGIARKLMEHNMGDAKDMGYEQIWLGVYEENDRARRFYGKFGFERIGEHHLLVGKDLQTDLVMIASLETNRTRISSNS